MYLTKLKTAVKMITENIEFTKLYQDLGVVEPKWQNVTDLFYRVLIHIDIKKYGSRLLLMVWRYLPIPCWNGILQHYGECC